MSLNPLAGLRRLLEGGYGLLVLTLFVVLGSLAFLLVTLVPGLSLRARRGIAHFVSRAFFFCSAIPIKLIDAHLLPAGPCLVVANHASYLDGVVLKGALPARFSFVIKKVMSQVPVAGLLLRRIGSEFVDRFNRHAGGMDARRLIKSAATGQSLAFFPEGTFVAEPGVGKFHTGAFMIAARAALPVVPVAIRGTRNILPSGKLLPRPGRVEIQVLAPVALPQGVASTAIATMTSAEARARIIAALGEPDRADSDGTAALQPARKAGSH